MLSSCIWPSCFLSSAFITTMVVPLSAFLIFISLLCVKALRASRSAGGRLFFGFASFKSAISLFTSSR